MILFCKFSTAFGSDRPWRSESRKDHEVHNYDFVDAAEREFKDKVAAVRDGKERICL